MDQRLPDAPYRQWVFRFPRRLRVALAKDGALWSEVLRACVRKVFVYQRGKARTLGIDAPKTLAVGFAQRFGSLLPLNPHAHMAVPDAVWSDGRDGTLTSCELQPPTDDEVEAVGLAAVKAVLRIVARAADRAAGEPDDEPALLEALADAAAAATPMAHARPTRTRRRDASEAPR